MAHKKAGGSTTLGRDSQGKRLGVKLPQGAYAQSGAIIVRQRGTRFRPGTGVARGNDDTLFANAPGFVVFKRQTRITFTGSRRYVNIVSVVKEKVEKAKTEVKKSNAVTLRLPS